MTMSIAAGEMQITKKKEKKKEQCTLFSDKQMRLKYFHWTKLGHVM